MSAAGTPRFNRPAALAQGAAQRTGTAIAPADMTLDFPVVAGPRPEESPFCSLAKDS